MLKILPLGGVIIALTIVFGLEAISAAPGAARPAGSSNTAPSLQDAIEELAAKARPGRLGVTVIDLTTGQRWGVDQDHAFPMMSVFKAPVAAAVLDLVDRSALSLTDTVTLDRTQLRKGTSDIARTFKGERMPFTTNQLLKAAVSHSDNTAIDALIRRIGGPDVVTRFLRTHGIDGMRIDLDEGTVEQVFSGIHAGENPPPHETAEQRDARLWRGYLAFLRDPRNRSTPKAAAVFLQKLWNGALLSNTSTHRLLRLMYAQTKPVRLRAGLPPGARLADKCGTSISMHGVTAAFNDIGIMTLPGGRAVIMSVFLTESKASRQQRTALFAELTRQVASRTRRRQ